MKSIDLVCPAMVEGAALGIWFPAVEASEAPGGLVARDCWALSPECLRNLHSQRVPRLC